MVKKTAYRNSISINRKQLKQQLAVDIAQETMTLKESICKDILEACKRETSPQLCFLPDCQPVSVPVKYNRVYNVAMAWKQYKRFNQTYKAALKAQNTAITDVQQELKKTETAVSREQVMTFITTYNKLMTQFRNQEKHMGGTIPNGR